VKFSAALKRRVHQYKYPRGPRSWAITFSLPPCMEISLPCSFFSRESSHLWIKMIFQSDSFSICA
jgi:hypothetical protein